MTKVVKWYQRKAAAGRREYNDLLHFGSQNDLLMDKLCAAFLALSPILQHYRGPHDAGVMILILAFPWLAFRLIRSMGQVRASHLAAVSGLVLFCFYKGLAHGFSFMNFAHSMVLAAYFILAASGAINVKYLLKTAGIISVAASFLVMLQYICFYVFRFHLQLVPIPLLLPECEQWFAGIKTGLVGINGRASGLYRPCAFFLEPSHMFLYVFPHLFIMLFSSALNKWKLSMAVILSLGIVLTTSGMGVLTVGFAWALLIALWDGKGKELKFGNLKKKKNLIRVGIFAGLGIILIVCVPFLRSAVLRFLDPSKRGAIAGRSRLAWDLVGKMTVPQLIFGVSNNIAGIKFNMPGLIATIYKFGIIGVILSYTTYTYGLLRLKGSYFWISFMIFFISLSSAHTHGTFYMLYYVLILMEGREDLHQRKLAARRREKKRRYRG